MALSDDHAYTGRRRALIETIRETGINDLDLLALFDEVSRHHFLPRGLWPRAYEDAALPIGHGQTSSQPSLQARYLQLLEPRRGESVLEIGTGCGFFTALLARMTDRVYSMEREPALMAQAREALDGAGVRNVALMCGDGSLGWQSYAPFQVIVVSAAAPSVPGPLVDQLDEGGRMLVPVGDGTGQRLVLVRRDGFAVTEQPLDHVVFVPLVGKYGFAPGESAGTGLPEN